MLVTLGVAAGAAIAACGFDAAGIAGIGNDPDTAPPPEASLPNLDAGFDGTQVADADADAPVDPCPATGRGPAMVPVPDAGYCVDSTEVTNAQYNAFLAATGNGRVDSGVVDGGQPTECSFNTTYRRKDATEGGAPLVPAVQLNWCDAYAFCTWSGKRLCGRIPSDRDAAAGEWYAACTNNGSQSFPYGPTASGSACVETGSEAQAVGSKPSCEGGVPGAYDMSGNVREWVDSCSAIDYCSTAGSAYTPSALPDQGSCRDAVDYPRVQFAPFIGIRCCADTR